MGFHHSRAAQQSRARVQQGRAAPTGPQPLRVSRRLGQKRKQALLASTCAPGVPSQDADAVKADVDATNGDKGRPRMHVLDIARHRDLMNRLNLTMQWQCKELCMLAVRPLGMCRAVVDIVFVSTASDMTMTALSYSCASKPCKLL